MYRVDSTETNLYKPNGYVETKPKTKSWKKNK